MTTATGPEDPAAIPDPLTEREQTIRQIHRFADWLTAHPDAPAPTSIQATCHVGDAAEVGAWADQSGASRRYHGGSVWAELSVCELTPKIRLTWFVTSGLPGIAPQESPAARWAAAGGETNA